MATGITIIWDPADRPQRFSVNASGVTAVRNLRATGAVHPDPAQRFWAVLQLGTVPKYGDAHPIIPGITVKNIECVGNDATLDVCDLEITWGAPEFGLLPPESGDPEVEVGGSVTIAQTSIDVNGNAIIIPKWDDPFFVGPPAPGEDPPQLPAQGGSVEYSQPMSVRRLRRRENISALDLADRADFYVGRVNGAVWANRNPRTMLCTMINGRSIDGGTTFVVEYGFQFNRDTWDATIAYVDPNTGQVHGGIGSRTSGKGVLTGIRVQYEADFNVLNL